MNNMSQDPKKKEHGNKYRTAFILLITVVAVYIMAIYKKYGG